MAKYQSKILQGKANVPTAGVSGVVVSQEVEFVAPAGGLKANDVIEMAILPADAKIVDAILQAGVAGAVTVGIMSGETVSAEQYISATTTAADEIVRMNKGYTRARNPDADRIIGVTAAVVIPAGTYVYLQIQYTQ